MAEHQVSNASAKDALADYIRNDGKECPRCHARYSLEPDGNPSWESGGVAYRCTCLSCGLVLIEVYTLWAVLAPEMRTDMVSLHDAEDAEDGITVTADENDGEGQKVHVQVGGYAGRLDTQKLCPECHVGRVQLKSGKLVCSKCGRIWTINL